MTRISQLALSLGSEESHPFLTHVPRLSDPLPAQLPACCLVTCSSQAAQPCRRWGGGGGGAREGLRHGVQLALPPRGAPHSRVSPLAWPGLTRVNQAQQQQQQQQLEVMIHKLWSVLCIQPCS